MPQADDPRPSGRARARRCPACGSHLNERARQCDICGEPVPWRFTPFGPLGESLVVVALVLAVAAGLLAVRHRGGPGLAAPEAAVVAVRDERPTPAPTFTRRPPATATLLPNTPIPPPPTGVPEFITYTVESGDTLIAIAQEFDQTSETILGANQDTLPNAHDLSIGQQLRIPVQGGPGEAVESPPVADAGAESPPPVGEPGSSIVEEPAELSADMAKALGLPTAEVQVAGAPPDAATAPVVESAGSGAAVVQPGAVENAGSLIEAERSSAVAFPPPVPVVPADGAILTANAPTLRWSSAGVLPAGLHYVVTLTEADVDGAKPRYIWIMTNATALRLPGDARPALGTSKAFKWTVSVRQRTGRLIGTDEGELRSRPSEERRFVWSP